MTDKATYLVDVAVGNDKIFTVPDGRTFEVVSGSARITTTADVGSRTPPRLELRDENDTVIFTVDGTASVAASQTDAAFGVVSTAAAAEMTIIPILVPPGGSIRFYDAAAIEATDTLEVRLVALVRSA
jgi:hypothetical protein